MLSLMNYSVRRPDEKATFVDIYVGGQQIAANIPINQLNIKLVTKSETGEPIAESLVFRQFDQIEEKELLLNEGTDNPGC
jgi:hypothetical protein